MTILQKVQNRWTDIDISGCDALFRETLDQLVRKTAVDIERFHNQFPFIGDGEKYVLTENTTWVSGYWTAWLWLVYNHTKDPVFREAAEKHFEGYNRRFKIGRAHV